VQLIFKTFNPLDFPWVNFTQTLKKSKDKCERLPWNWIWRNEDFQLCCFYLVIVRQAKVWLRIDISSTPLTTETKQLNTSWRFTLIRTHLRNPRISSRLQGDPSLPHWISFKNLKIHIHSIQDSITQNPFDALFFLPVRNVPVIYVTLELPRILMRKTSKNFGKRYAASTGKGCGKMRSRVDLIACLAVSDAV